MKIRNNMMSLSLLMALALACNEPYLEEDGLTGPNGGNNQEIKEDVDLGDLPELDFSTDYITPELGNGPSEVVLSQTVSTVNGEPFIPLMLYSVEPAQMSFVKAMGFNVVHTYSTRGDNKEDYWKEYMTTAEKNGLMVLFNLAAVGPSTSDEARIRKMVEAVKDSPALYAWYLADEPFADTPENRESHKDNIIDPASLEALYNMVKSLDGGRHPVINSNWELDTFLNSCDLDARQFYDGVPFKLTPDLTGYLNGNEKYNKPWLSIVNAYDSCWGTSVEKSVNPNDTFKPIADEFGKGSPEWAAERALWEPFIRDLDHPEKYMSSIGFTLSAAYPKTLAELRGSLYWSLVHGSNGFLYWRYNDPDPELMLSRLEWDIYTVFHRESYRNEITRVFKEMSKISKYLVNPSDRSISFFDKTYPGVYVWSKQVDKRRIVIILNETGAAFNGTIDLSKLYITGNQLREYNYDGATDELVGNESAVMLDGDGFQDSFVKDEVKIYFVENKGMEK